MKYIVLCILSILTSTLLSQERSKFSDRIIENDLVVLGEIVDQYSVWSSNRESMYTESLIRVDNYIKGQGLDTICLVTLGGVDDTSFQIVPDAYRPNNGQTGYFFLDRLRDYDLYSSSFQYEYFTISSSSSYIKTNSILRSKMTALEEQSNLKILEIAFDNIHLAEDGFLSFNILFKVNSEASGFKIASSELFLKYSSDFFGEYIDSSGRIIINKGLVIDSEGIGLESTDQSEDIVKVELISPCAQNFNLSDGLPLSVNFQEVLSVKISPENLAQIGSITIDDFETDGKIWYKNPLNSICNAFDTILYPNEINTQNLCSITSFSSSFNPNNSSQISGGTDEVLTITGTNFDQLPGNVSFPNADNVGGPPSITDPIDFAIPGVTNWGMSQIQVKVPSTPITAGSGIFEVNTVSGMTCSSQSSLDVVYSHLNTRNTTTNVAMKIYNSDFPDDNDGQFILSIDNNIQNNADALDAIKTAICDWNGLTQIDWRNSLNSVPNAGASSQDNINTIFFALPGLFVTGPNPNPAASARTLLTGARVNSCFEFSAPSTGILYTTDIDLAIREDLTLMMPPAPNGWNFNKSAVPNNGQLDFYSIVLHELGHVHILEHTLSTSDIMYFSLTIGAISRTISMGDVQGGVDMLAFSNSALTPTGSNNCPTPITTSSICQVVDIDERMSNVVNINLYPNPANDFIMIDFGEVSSIGNMDLAIFDMNGRIVYKKPILSGDFLNNNTVQIPIHSINLTPSIYSVKIFTGSDVFTGKFIYHAQ